MSHSSLLQPLYRHYETHGRHDLPWRRPEADGTFDPYKICISEVMLQQTQVPRVIAKYKLFIDHYPDVQALAVASFEAVLRDWSGLGYNRRARFLHQAAKQVVDRHGGVFPRNIEGLDDLPGVGYDTAAAIYVYSYDEPAVFIETNVRTVFIHECFPGDDSVSDAQIKPLLQAALEGQDPRTFYWALMDYGAHLKKTRTNNISRSAHYVKQAAFKGSNRELRGKVLRLLLQEGRQPADSLPARLGDERTADILAKLVREGVLTSDGPSVMIAE